MVHDTTCVQRKCRVEATSVGLAHTRPILVGILFLVNPFLSSVHALVFGAMQVYVTVLTLII